MKHLGLFEGIGGFSLAARWMGWETIVWVEIDKFCQKVLKKNFPNAKGYGDIKQFDGSAYRGTVDILTGGFPCQPFSSAGKRKGTEDDRHLWPEMLRVIGEVQPRWVVGENVSGLLNWNGGLVLKQIKTDLENTGYTMLPPAILPACSKNAPHRRDRIWLTSYSTEHFSNYENRCSNGSHTVQEERFNESETITNSRGNGCQRDKGTETRYEYIGGWKALSFTNPHDEPGSSSNTNSPGLEVMQQQSNGEKFQAFKRNDNQWENWPTVPGVCGGNDGIPNRVDRIKSLGNAIVPQVAYEIFKAIELVTLQN